MKTAIHPEYKKTVIKCACGAEFETKSTVFPEMHVELCSVCHPFYTGKQKFVDTAGRVDKFRARLEKAQAKANLKGKIKNTKAEGRSNTEKLAEIKSSFAKAPLNKEASVEPTTIKADATEEEITVAQEENSGVDKASTEELKESK